MDLGDALIDAASIGPGDVVALVGAGGKTTLMWALHDAADRRGWRVRAGTTTRVAADQVPAGREFLFQGHEVDKLVGVSADAVDDVVRSGEFDLVVVEADGARGKVVKAPADHEPVIPSSTTLLIVVIGADALDRVIEDVAHRPMLVAAVCGCGPYERLTVARAARLVTSSSGSRKGIPLTARQLVAVTRVGPRQSALADALVTEVRTAGHLAVALPDIGAGYSPRP